MELKTADEDEGEGDGVSGRGERGRKKLRIGKLRLADELAPRRSLRVAKDASGFGCSFILMASDSLRCGVEE